MGVMLQAFYWDCPGIENREHEWWSFIKSSDLAARDVLIWDRPTEAVMFVENHGCCARQSDYQRQAASICFYTHPRRLSVRFLAGLFQLGSRPTRQSKRY